MPDILKTIQLNSLIDWIAAWGMLLVLLYLRSQDRSQPLVSKSRYLFANLFVFFALRGLLWSWPSKSMDVVAYYPAVTLPLAELLFIEGLLKKPFPKWLKMLVAVLGVLYALLNATGLRLGVHPVEAGFTVFALSVIFICILFLAFRDRTRLSSLENRYIDAIFLACVFVMPLTAIDFMDFQRFPIRMGGVAALLMAFTLGRSAGRLDVLRLLMAEYFMMAVRIALIAVCVQIVVGKGDLHGLGETTALVAALVLLLTMMGQFRILAMRRRDDSFLTWVRRLQTNDVDEFVAALQDFPLTRDHEMLRLEDLNGFERKSIRNCLASEHGVVDLASLEFKISHGASGVESVDAAETARLLKSRGMNRAFSVHSERGLYLLFRGMTVGGDDTQAKKLALVQQMAASLEAHDLLLKRDEALRHAQKMEALGRLAGGVSHEFGNLLMVIRGYAQALARALGPDHPSSSDVAEVVTATDRASALTRQLLIFSRKQKSERELLDLREVLNGSEKMLSMLLPKTVSLEWHAPASEILVHADRSQIEQIVMNLVINARDAMPGGGSISLELARESTSAKLTVKDTGQGMDEATRLRIFEPFFTTKPKGQGTGLGLSTVYGIVEQSGGRIEVKSVLGHGSRFDIWLPLA